MSKLKPKEITVESSVKFFELDRGMSSGSMLSITYEIPEGMDQEQLKIARLKEKERLDLTLLSMEVARGGMSVENFISRKNAVKKNYNKLLKRETDEEDS